MDLAPVRRLLRAARRPVALTGAGISAESGVPTFRDASTGLWRNFRPEDLATPEAFRRDPKTVWEWYDWRRTLIAETRPNPGHHALARIPGLTLITQNVDGLHELAGSSPLNLHGSIWTLRCLECGRETTDRRVPLPDLPPRCAECGGMLRPGVVWFGEALPDVIWDNAEKAARNADLLLVVGTSAVVYPAASLVPIAARAGADIVEINPGETPVTTSVTYSLRGPAGRILPELIEEEP